MRVRKRLRMDGYDYSADNLYFVTTNIQIGTSLFGKIENDVMILNSSGEIAHNQFLWLNNQYPYIKIHEFVVMPDHVHLMIEINRNLLNETIEISDIDLDCGDNVMDGRGNDLDRGNVVDGRDHLRYPRVQNHSAPTKIKSLPQLIGAYKTTVSKQIHLMGMVDFKWQRSYHDRIVRNQLEYCRILDYIINNPRNWKKKKTNHGSTN